MGETQPTGSSKKRIWLVTVIVLAAVVIDQAIKLYTATHFALGESREVTSWFWLCYIENNGMAFGIEWFSKLALTLFRIVAVGLLGWYTHMLIHRSETPVGYLSCIAFIIAGALGNIIDCVFYGKLFGYEGWFYGRVVDIFYFPAHSQQFRRRALLPSCIQFCGLMHHLRRLCYYSVLHEGAEYRVRNKE